MKLFITILIIMKSSGILLADEIKFSGTEGSKEELSRFYTLIEGILEKYLRITETTQTEEDKK